MKQELEHKPENIAKYLKPEENSNIRRKAQTQVRHALALAMLGSMPSRRLGYAPDPPPPEQPDFQSKTNTMAPFAGLKLG